MALTWARLLDAARRWTVPNLKQFRHSRQPIVWLLAPFIGLAGGGAAILFRLAIAAFQVPWLGTMSESVTAAAREQPWWVILIAPAVARLLVGLMLQYLLTAKRT
jgi:CIC family chloride channel protein